MEEEVWKPVPFAPRYEASNMGRIRDTERGSLLKSHFNNGYERVELVTQVSAAKFYVHRVVYETFKGAIPPDMSIDHINFSPSDNRLSNLRCIPYGLNMRRRNKNKYKHFTLCLEGTEFKMSFGSISEMLAHLYSTYPRIPISIRNLRRTLYYRISAGVHSYHVRETSITIEF